MKRRRIYVNIIKMQIRTYWPLIAIVLAAVLAIIIFAICTPISREKRKLELYEKIHAATTDYPTLSAAYQSTACYYTDGTVGYLLLQIGNRQAVGVRDTDGSVLYFAGDQCWRLDTQGSLVNVDAESFPVADVVDMIKNAVDMYSTQEGIAIAYKRNKGPALPYGVGYQDKYYISIARPGYDAYTENMVIHDSDEGETLIWCIVDAEGRSKMYLKIWDHVGDFYMRDWANIPEDIIRILVA